VASDWNWPKAPIDRRRVNARSRPVAACRALKQRTLAELLPGQDRPCTVSHLKNLAAGLARRRRRTLLTPVNDCRPSPAQAVL
jgi:hypothetical protein